MNRRITPRDKIIWNTYLRNDRRIKPTVAELRSIGWTINPEAIKQTVAKVSRLME